MKIEFIIIILNNINNNINNKVLFFKFLKDFFSSTIIINIIVAISKTFLI